MEFKDSDNYFTFINLIVLGTNICAERLAIITNKDIPSPFVLEKETVK